ncbi:MAG: hypothetical protein C4570_07825 [Ammonifex sp.]|nr:MAG: hypothetical protein C4570_07825 [Ammonifex sp.]
MAAGTLPKPGTEYGPCEKPCKHRDCNLTKQMAETPCGLCGKPIGYGTRFYMTAVNQLAHAACEELEWHGRELKCPS